jgi:hypothetical protein
MPSEENTTGRSVVISAHIWASTAAAKQSSRLQHAQNAARNSLRDTLFAATGMVSARLVMRNFFVPKHTRLKRFLDPDQRFRLGEISPNGETFSVSLSFFVAKFREIFIYLFLINLQSLS